MKVIMYNAKLTQWGKIFQRDIFHEAFVVEAEFMALIQKMFEVMKDAISTTATALRFATGARICSPKNGYKNTLRETFAPIFTKIILWEYCSPHYRIVEFIFLIHFSW